MRYLFSLPIVVFIFSSLGGNAQSRSQIRFKMGAVKSFAIPDNSRNYVYRIRSSPTKWAGGFALEYFLYGKKNKANSWFAGIASFEASAGFSLNRANFQYYDNDQVVGKGESLIQFYGGLQKRISKPGAKNNFGIMGGLGLVTHFNDHSGWVIIPYGSEGVTIKSEQFKSYYNSSGRNPGYSTRIDFSHKFKITPTVFTGIRCQWKNKKGNDGVGVELLANYGLSKYFEYDVPYTIDGLGYKDSFDYKAISAQLNLIIPLRNFGNKKRNADDAD